MTKTCVNTNDKTESHRRHKEKGTKGNLADKKLNWEHKKTQKQLERNLKVNAFQITLSS